MTDHIRRVLVSGGAGFVGSHLVDRLLADGAQVLVVDDFSSGSPDNLAHHAANPRFAVFRGDILDYENLEKLCEGVDEVYHLACRNVRLSLRRPTEVHEVNASGTLNMLKAASAARVRKFLYCSSSEVNGTADIVPMPEDYNFKPETIYGASKLTGEYYSNVFHRSGWLETVVVRPHNNYGPREHYQGYLGEVIPRFILRNLMGLPAQIYGDGRQTRDFTYVEESADFFVRIMASPETSGLTLNLCRGEEVSIRRLAELSADLTGSGRAPEYLPGRPSDVLRLFGDNSRLKSVLGDAPRIGIEEGFRRTVNWFKDHVPLTEATLNTLDSRSWEVLETEKWLSAHEQAEK